MEGRQLLWCTSKKKPTQQKLDVCSIIQAPWRHANVVKIIIIIIDKVVEHLQKKKFNDGNI